MSHPQYSETMLKSMQSAYGDGFLSPGAAVETRQMLEGVSMQGKSVLDFGCGVGGASVLVATEYPVREVVGVDVEDAQIESARSLAQAHELPNVEFHRTSPGKLPFVDDRFDIVITKDVICHVKDKLSLFKEVKRVMAPGGVFIVGDWHPGDVAEQGTSWSDWMAHLAGGGLIFYFEPAETYKVALTGAGFSPVLSRDHTAWSRHCAKEQLAEMTGVGHQTTLAELGEVAYERRVAMTKARYTGLDDGSVEHWLLSAYKP